MCRNVVGLLISIVEDATEVLAAAATSPPCPTEGIDSRTRTPSDMSRFWDLAFAVDEAFDLTLTQLARDLRSTAGYHGSGGGRAGFRGIGRKRIAAATRFLSLSATALATRAGLFLYGYETAVDLLLQVFFCLSESGDDAHEEISFGQEAISSGLKNASRTQNGEGGSGSGARRGSPKPAASGGSSFRERPAVEARCTAWTQNKLEVLGELVARPHLRWGRLRRELALIVSFICCLFRQMWTRVSVGEPFPKRC